MAGAGEMEMRLVCSKSAGTLAKRDLDERWSSLTDVGSGSRSAVATTFGTGMRLRWGVLMATASLQII